MNHAVFCVTFKSRAISYELTPFLQFTISHIAQNHLSRPIGESSNTVPTLSENLRRAMLCQRSARLARSADT